MKQALSEELDLMEPVFFCDSLELPDGKKRRSVEKHDASRRRFLIKSCNMYW